MTEFLLIIFIIVGAVTSYALGYFRERGVVEPPEETAERPSDADGSLRALFETYSEEVKVKYLRNHSRRRADKFLKEFALGTVHFALFIGMAVACATISSLAKGAAATEILVGLTFLTMALKAGQLTAAKETVERKERLLIHHTELVNLARKNMMAHCDKDIWIKALHIRDEKTPLHY